jgi:hypothetical protein
MFGLKLFLVKSFAIQSATAIAGILTVPLLVRLSGSDIFANYLYYYSLAMIFALFVAGLSLNLSSIFEKKRKIALNLYRWSSLVLLVLSVLLFSMGLDYYLLPIISLTFITSESARGVAISKDKFLLFQKINLFLKLALIIILYSLTYELFAGYNISEHQITFLLAGPSVILFFVFLKKEVISKAKLYYPRDYYALNGKLTISRFISGSQEHIVKIAAINVLSSDSVAIYEFFIRICKQSKAVIDSVVSFFVRNFEKKKFFKLRYLLYTQFSFSFIFYIFTLLVGEILIKNSLFPFIDIAILNLLPLLFIGYMALLSTTVLLHFNVSESSFSSILQLAIVRLSLNLIMIVFLVYLDLSLFNLILMSSSIMLIIGWLAFWHLLKAFKV